MTNSADYTKKKAKADEYSTEYNSTDEGKNRWNAYINNYNNKKPVFSTTYSDKLKNVESQIENYKPFSYDVNSDQLYQQYKNQYVNLGRNAMQDTMGQAAALTGGYGNSYASTAGNQAYQSYLSQLNDKIPELYQLALSKYNSDKDDLYNLASLYNQGYSRDYSTYRDDVSDWQYDNSSLLDIYNLGQSTYNDNRDYYTSLADTQLQTMIDNAISMNDFDTLDSLGYDTTNMRTAYNASLYSGSGDTDETTTGLYTTFSDIPDTYISKLKGMRGDDEAQQDYLADLIVKGILPDDDAFIQDIIEQVNNSGQFGGAKKRSTSSTIGGSSRRPRISGQWE